MIDEMPRELFEKAKGGDIRALARLISRLEERSQQALELMASLYDVRQGAHILGVTGPPGAGKSTLVNRLIAEFRAQDKRVAVIAIDPSSPFSGGALLGDRIRMIGHATDKSVFIRSIGSRGAKGGLSRAAGDMAACLDAVGFDQIIIETVGVGQTELDILQLATTTLVVLVPEAGDVIQTMKAGLMEIADVFAVNKADRDGAKALVQNLRSSLQTFAVRQEAQTTNQHFSHHHMSTDEIYESEQSEGWQILVKPVSALKNEGIVELMSSLEQHKEFAAENQEHLLKQEQMREAHFYELLRDEIGRRIIARSCADKNVQAVLKNIKSGVGNPYLGIEKIVKEFLA